MQGLGFCLRVSSLHLKRGGLNMFLYLAWWSNVPWKVFLLNYPTGISPLIHWKEGNERDEGRMNEGRRRRAAMGCWTGKEGRCLSFLKGLFKCHILALIFFSFHFVTQVKSPVEESCRHLEHLSWCWGCCLENLSCTVSASVPRNACVGLLPAGNLRPQILSRVPMAWGFLWQTDRVSSKLL